MLIAQFTMIARFLLSLVLPFVALQTQAQERSNKPEGVWVYSPVGHCFSSLDDYLEKTFGADYRNDPAIVVRPVFIKGNKSKDKFWVADTTPGINFTQVLFEVKGPGGRACAVLYAPYSSVFNIHFPRDGSFPPTAFIEDTPPPGIKGNRVVFKFVPKDRIYVPEKCFKFYSERDESEEVSCGEVFQ